MAENLKKILKGVLISLVLSILAMVILAVIVFFADIPDRTISTLVLVLSALSVFLGAVVLAKNIDSRGLINGLLLGGIYFAVLVLVSCLSGGGIAFEMGNVLRCVSVLAAGMLGGVLGINTKKA